MKVNLTQVTPLALPVVAVRYLAGFVDGEGSLSLNRIPRRGRSTEYCARLSITNCNREVLEEIQSSYGGTLALNRFGNPRWKLGYALIWTNAAAIRVIETISPFLNIKARHAEVLLEFADHIRRCRRQRDEKGRLLSLSEREKETRRAFFRRMRLLNSRGRPKIGTPSPARPMRGVGRGQKVSVQYLAGFMDGEGSIMITKSTGKSVNPYYRARVYVANTNRQVLRDIREGFGGIPVTIRHHRHETWKTGYGLVWSNGMVRGLLRRLGPHLRLKRRQADLVLSFVDHVRKTPRSRKGRFFIPHPKSVVEVREAFYQMMKKLNTRGRAAPAS